MNPYGSPGNADSGPDDDFDADMITMNPPRWQRWRHGRPIAVAGVAIAALAGGAGVGYAATHSVAKSGAPDSAAVAAESAATPAPSPAPAKPGGRGWRSFAGGFAGGPGIAFGIGGAVHGQLTVPKSGGGYETVDVQRGTVTAVSSSSITVKSADGFTASYTVTSKTLVDAQAAGIGSVKKGDTVAVTATVSGSTATAANVFDMTAIDAGRAASGFPFKERPANLPGAPAQVQAPSA